MNKLPTLCVVILGLIIWVIWIWPGLNILPTVDINSNILYMLSAIAQALAAVLALVFTISLIVAQLSSRYSHRMLPSFFDKCTIGYILLFIAAVLLPLFILNNPNPNVVKTSLMLATVCLLLLIPYFLRFREKLNPESVISDLKRKATRQLQTNLSKEPEATITIDNFVMSAFILKDYDTLTHGVETLADLALEAYETEKGDNGKRTIQRLIDIAITTIEDPRAPIQVLKALGNISTRLTEKELSSALQEVTSSLGKIGYKAADKELDDLVNWSIEILSSISKKAIEKSLGDVTSQIVDLLGNMGAKAAEKGLEDCTIHVAETLTTICTSAVNKLSTKDTDESLKGAAELAIDKLGFVGAKAAQNSLENAAVRVADILSNNASMPSYFARRTTFSLGEDIGVSAIDNGLEQATTTVIYALAAVGINAVHRDFDDAADRAAFYLGAVCTKATEEGMENIANQGINCISDIGHRAIEKKLSATSNEAINALGNIGVQSVIKVMENCVRQAASKLSGLGIDTNEKGFNKLIDPVINWLINFGAWAIYYNNPDLKGEAINNLRSFVEKTNFDITTVDFPKAKNLCLLYRVNNYEEFLVGDPGLFTDRELEEAFKTFEACCQQD